MVKQYLHTIKFRLAGTATQDANGDWVTSPATDHEFSCRAEPNSKGETYQVDGQQVVNEWMVYAPKSFPVIPVGTEVTVYNGKDLLLINKVKRFSNGQLNVRIWL